MLSTSFPGISLFAAFIFFFAASPPTGASVIVVDDANTDRITYTASADIGVYPTYASAYNGTFYPLVADISTNVFFTFTFTGTSVEVRYIAADRVEPAFITNTNVRYSIDGVTQGTAVRNPENRNSYVYNQTLFKVAGLANVGHTLRVDLLPPSILLFDYLVYEGADTTTTPNTTNPSSDEKKSSSTQLLAAILGGTGAGVITLILGGVLVWYIMRKRRKREEGKNNLKNEPDVSPPRPDSPSPKSADVSAAPHQPPVAPYGPPAATPATPYQPPAAPYQPPPTPFPPSAGSPQDPGWDEVNRLMSMASNQERDPTTPSMNKAPDN